MTHFPTMRTLIAVTLLHVNSAGAFVAPTTSAPGCQPNNAPVLSSATLDEVETSPVVDSQEEKRQRIKRDLLGRLGEKTFADPVLVDPDTKEPLLLSSKGPLLGDSKAGVAVTLESESGSTSYGGRSNTYYDLLQPVAAAEEVAEAEKTSVSRAPILSSLLSFAPPPLRGVLANLDSNVEYVPMRDLFTSPQVSFAYERGWRQGFQAAGFPGADAEYLLAKEYFEPVIASKRAKGDGTDVLVDMSCATGLFTRRFAKSGDYTRVIACDYSESMLNEARRRIREDADIANAPTKLDLVRCDVGRIPMRTDSVDAFHAGAAMHCWPEIEKSLQEIHRVLVPGGRYFATTFLGNYFNTVASAERASNGGEDIATNMQAFQYFPTKEFLRDLLLDAGFESDRVTVEVVGTGCVIIRAEKTPYLSK